MPQLHSGFEHFMTRAPRGMVCGACQLGALGSATAQMTGVADKRLYLAV
jgi:hypothetical protein